MCCAYVHVPPVYTHARPFPQFARSLVSSDEYAIKFYVHRTAFERERTLYQDETLRSMMPATHALVDNLPSGPSGDVVRAPNGYIFPPCIIIERGESLDEWARRETPDFITIMQARASCFRGVSFCSYAYKLARVRNDMCSSPLHAPLCAQQPVLQGPNSVCSCYAAL